MSQGRRDLPGLAEQPMHHAVVRGSMVLQDAFQNGLMFFIRIEERVRREEALLMVAGFPLRQRGMDLCAE